MKLNQTILLLHVLLIAILTGCVKEKEADATAQLLVEGFDDMAEISESNLIKSASIVSLQDVPFPIGEISKIIGNDSLLYILDSSGHRRVHIVSTNGAYINTIDNYGQGPNEYFQLSDIFYDKSQNRLCVLSRIDRKLLEYSHDGGTLVEVKILPMPFASLIKTGDMYVGYMSNWAIDADAPYNYWTMDGNFEIEGSFVKINEVFSGAITPTHRMLSVYNETVNMTDYMGNNVYSCTPTDSIFTEYSYDFGKRNLPQDYEQKYHNNLEWIKLTHDHIAGLHFFQETESYFIARISYHGQKCLVVTDKNTFKSKVFSCSDFLSEYYMQLGNILGIDQYNIYAVLSAENIYDLWKGYDEYNNFEELYPEQVKNLRAKFPNIDEEDNPFIMIYGM